MEYRGTNMMHQSGNYTAKDHIESAIAIIGKGPQDSLSRAIIEALEKAHKLIQRG